MCSYVTLIILTLNKVLETNIEQIEGAAAAAATITNIGSVLSNHFWPFGQTMAPWLLDK